MFIGPLTVYRIARLGVESVAGIPRALREGATRRDQQRQSKRVLEDMLTERRIGSYEASNVYAYLAAHGDRTVSATDRYIELLFMGGRYPSSEAACREAGFARRLRLREFLPEDEPLLKELSAQQLRSAKRAQRTAPLRFLLLSLCFGAVGIVLIIQDIDNLFSSAGFLFVGFVLLAIAARKYRMRNAEELRGSSAR